MIITGENLLLTIDSGVNGRRFFDNKKSFLLLNDHYHQEN